MSLAEIQSSSALNHAAVFVLLILSAVILSDESHEFEDNMYNAMAALWDLEEVAAIDLVLLTQFCGI